ncbi:MAG TPA: hypothetical protein PLU53_02085 [Bacteroidia bacterium]|nr:hypothetical protein [Bacteroidia bacterium]
MHSIRCVDWVVSDCFVYDASGLLKYLMLGTLVLHPTFGIHLYIIAGTQCRQLTAIPFFVPLPLIIKKWVSLKSPGQARGGRAGEQDQVKKPLNPVLTGQRASKNQQILHRIGKNRLIVLHGQIAVHVHLKRMITVKKNLFRVRPGLPAEHFVIEKTVTGKKGRTRNAVIPETEKNGLIKNEVIPVIAKSVPTRNAANPGMEKSALIKKEVIPLTGKKGRFKKEAVLAIRKKDPSKGAKIQMTGRSVRIRKEATQVMTGESPL